MNVDLVIVLPIFDSEERPFNYEVDHISQIIKHQEDKLNDRIIEPH